jgi:hypothetical protein
MREHKNSVRKLKQRRDGVRDIAKVIPQVHSEGSCYCYYRTESVLKC